MLHSGAGWDQKSHQADILSPGYIIYIVLTLFQVTKSLEIFCELGYMS